MGIEKLDFEVGGAISHIPLHCQTSHLTSPNSSPHTNRLTSFTYRALTFFGVPFQGSSARQVNFLKLFHLPQIFVKKIWCVLQPPRPQGEKFQITNPNNQIITNNQITNSKKELILVWTFENWSLRFLWSLVLGAWKFLVLLAKVWALPLSLATTWGILRLTADFFSFPPATEMFHFAEYPCAASQRAQSLKLKCQS